MRRSVRSPSGGRIPRMVQALRLPNLVSLPAGAPGTRAEGRLVCRLLLAGWVARQHAQKDLFRSFRPQHKKPPRGCSSSCRPPLR
eukprot:6320909-Heterocapsa_arctica.AAC.1